jgi:hypothetical protein
MAERSIANIVRRFAAESPDGIAIKFGDRSMSWMSDLRARPWRCRLRAYRASSA